MNQLNSFHTSQINDVENIPSVTGVAGAKILVDARKISDGGIGIYTQNLIQGMLSFGLEPTLLCDPVKVGDFTWSDSIELIEETAPGYSLDELVSLARRVDLDRYDLFHTPHYVLPFGITIPSVVTVHDLIHILYPQKWYYPYVARSILRSSLKRAARVIVVSRSTEHDLDSFLGMSSRIREKVSYVPNALDSFFSEEPQDLSREGGFLAVLSMNKPHKGLEDLVAAYEHFSEERRQAGKPQVKLQIVGKGIVDALEDSSFLSRVSDIRGLELHGIVSREELRRAYRQARALVVPSHTEGFCLPVIEAQSQGTPVIARPVPAVKENLTKRDFLAKDFEVSSLVEAMHAAADREYGNENDERDEDHLRRYELQEVTKGVLSVYQDILGQGV